MEQDAVLIKVGNPLTFHNTPQSSTCGEVKRNCLFCNLVESYFTFECKHPDNNGPNYDFHEYRSACGSLEWNSCPLNPKNRELDLYATAVANGFSQKQAAKMALLSKGEFVKRINDLVHVEPHPRRLDKLGAHKIWVFKLNGKNEVSIC